MKTFLFILMFFALAVTASAQNIERMFQADVKIYLQKEVPPNGPSDLSLRPVERTVPNDFKLDYALEALFEENISEEEEEAGFSTSTFGLKFEGMSLRNGTVTVRFSEPNRNAEYLSLERMVFEEAVIKTATQFRFVKRVNICAVGKTKIDLKLGKPFPRCPAKAVSGKSRA